LAHIDLASDGCGDEGGATFLEEVDGSLGFSGEGIEFDGLGVKKLDNLMKLSRREFEKC
jgi:hypothetical protein